jgi:hypothetical protein
VTITLAGHRNVTLSLHGDVCEADPVVRLPHGVFFPTEAPA